MYIRASSASRRFTWRELQPVSAVTILDRGMVLEAGEVLGDDRGERARGAIGESAFVDRRERESVRAEDRGDRERRARRRRPQSSGAVLPTSAAMG